MARQRTESPRRSRDGDPQTPGLSPPPSPAPARRDSPFSLVRSTLDHYAEVEFFSLRSARPSSGGGPLSAVEREAQLWKATVARKLGRVPYHHRRCLETASKLRRSVAVLENRIREDRIILGSRVLMAQYGILNREQEQALRFVIDLKQAALSILRDQVTRTHKGNLHKEAVQLFDAVCSVTAQVRWDIYDSWRRRKR